MKLFVATRNKGKLREIEGLLFGLGVQLFSYDDFPDLPETVEDCDSFRGNAMKKGREAALVTGMLSLADDSGLVVDALGGAPGVYSARYAGKQGDHAANNAKLLHEMRDVEDVRRSARFVCSMALVSPDGGSWESEGICEGLIARDFAGSGGFGFDPLFYIPEFGKTMAELDLQVKNGISHRGRALRQIRAILIEILSEKGNG